MKLPVRSELRDDAGVPFAITIYTYDGPAFLGLPEGKAEKGLLTRTQELLMLESRLPAGYVGARDFTTLGYTLMGAGDTRGYYASKQAFRRDARGNIVEQKDPMGASSLIVYDPDGVFPVRRTDALGKVTTIDFQYNSGDPHKVSLPDGRQMRFETDPLGRMIAQFEVDDAGVEQLVKCWQLDTSSVPVAATSFIPQNGGRTTAEFFSAADLTKLLQVYVTREYLDGFGKQVLKITTAADGPGGVPRFAASGQVEKNPRKMTRTEFAPAFVADFGFIPTPPLATARQLHRYDAQGNLTETQGPGPAHFRFERDTFTLQHFEGSNAGAFGAPAPAGPASRTEFFDARDRVIRIEEAKGDGTIVSTSYDLTVDSRIAVIRGDSGSQTVLYTFAGPGEAVRIAHRDAGVRTYYRDASGRIAELVRADGSRLFYHYDLSRRPVKVEHRPPPPAAVSTVVREMFYDSDPGAPSAGRFLEERVALARELGNETRYTYNRNGSSVREDATVGATTLTTLREYNLRQEVTAITYPDGRRVVYALDASGAVQSIAGVVSQATYTAEGQLESYTCANGVQSTFARDLVSNRLNQISAARGGTSLRSISYTHDDLGNIVAMHDEIPGFTEHQIFTYDGLHRLTRYEARDNNGAGPLRRSETYAYSADGDLLQLGSNTLGYSDAAHAGRVTSVTTGGVPQNILYDDRGHVRSWSDEFNDLAYDPLDRVSQVIKTDGVVLRFAYDSQNRRILKQTVTGALTRNVLYATQIYEQHDTHAVRHIYLGNNLVASETVAAAVTAPIFFLSDHHGTILLGTDAAGATCPESAIRSLRPGSRLRRSARPLSGASNGTLRSVWFHSARVAMPRRLDVFFRPTGLFWRTQPYRCTFPRGLMCIATR